VKEGETELERAGMVAMKRPWRVRPPPYLCQLAWHRPGRMFPEGARLPERRGTKRASRPAPVCHGAGLELRL